MTMYDYQAHSEQIRHSQISAADRAEQAEYEATEGAAIALAEMPADELSYMILGDDRLTQKLDILLERVAMMGMPANNNHYRDDATRAAADLHRAMLDALIKSRIADLRLWGPK